MTDPNTRRNHERPRTKGHRSTVAMAIIMKAENQCERAHRLRFDDLLIEKITDISFHGVRKFCDGQTKGAVTTEIVE
jgi:hypothetical protein